MYRELKVVLSIIAAICIAIVLSQILFLNLLLGFLLIIAIAMIFLGDFIICYLLGSTRAIKWMERPPPGKEFGVLFSATGLVDPIWADKKPEGKREFVYNTQEASVINKGNYPIHNRAGGHGFVCAESHDESIDMNEVYAAMQWKEIFGTTDLKDIYYKTKALEKKMLKEEDEVDEQKQ